jgi:hypothetical protein
MVVLLLTLLSSAAAGRHEPGLCPLVDLMMMWAAAREVLEAPVPLRFLRRDRRMDSRCPCDPLVMVQASLPRTSARGHEENTSRAERLLGRSGFRPPY